MRIQLVTITIWITLSCKPTTNDTAFRPDTCEPIKILVYGLSAPIHSQVASIVAKEYGFSYYTVAGCIVTQELLDSVEVENKKSYEILGKRFGDNWREAFDEKVENMIAKYKRVSELVYSKSYVKELEQRLTNQNKYLEIDIQPVSNSTSFKVNLFEWEYVNDSSRQKLYYNLIVDPVAGSAIPASF